MWACSRNTVIYFQFVPQICTKWTVSIKKFYLGAHQTHFPDSVLSDSSFAFDSGFVLNSQFKNMVWPLKNISGFASALQMDDIFML